MKPRRRRFPGTSGCSTRALRRKAAAIASGGAAGSTPSRAYSPAGSSAHPSHHSADRAGAPCGSRARRLLKLAGRRRTGKCRVSHIDGRHPVPRRALACVHRAARRRPAAIGRFLHRQRQPALDPCLARRHPGRAAAGRLRLCRRLRGVPDHRRAARRPVWPAAAVPDRHGGLRRDQHAVRPRRDAAAACDRPHPAGRSRRRCWCRRCWARSARCSRPRQNSPRRSASTA